MADHVASCEQAMEAVAAIAGSKIVNVSAGCSGGQTASVLASKLAAKESGRMGTLTLMVCILHPKATGIEAGSLVSENGMQIARQRAMKAGVIGADNLARGFAWLRPNDLIWNYVIDTNLLGADPPALDVLYWNSDAPNLSKVISDLFILGGVTDHIRSWKATYRSTQLFGSKDVT